MTFLVNDADISVETMQLGPYGTNAYIVACQRTRDSMVVDAPADADRIIASLQGTNPVSILLTHGHSDHTGALAELRSRLKVPVAAYHADSRSLETPPEMALIDGDIISLGKLKIEVLHTPGHTAGSLCFKVGKYLLSGDTVFPGGPGKTWSPDDFRQIVDSITKKILPLPEDTLICPGHGEVTTVKKVKEEYAVFATRSHSPNLCGDVLWLSP